MSSLSAASANIASTITQTNAILTQQQQAEAVIGILQAGQQNLEALASQIEPPTLDGTGQTVSRRV